MDVRQIAKEIVAREGGYVNDPDDPGGATKYGVTLGTLARLGMDKTGDGKVTAADVKALSREVFSKFSPLTSSTTTEPAKDSRFGMTKPTPLPARVGATIITCGMSLAEI